MCIRDSVNAVLIPLKTHKLADLLNLARELPLAGVAVTMPLKQEVLAHLATSDPLTVSYTHLDVYKRQHPALACYGQSGTHESSLGTREYVEALANPDTAVYGRPRPRIHYRQRR